MKIKKIFISFIMIFLLVFAFFTKTNLIKAENGLDDVNNRWFTLSDKREINGVYYLDYTLSDGVTFEDFAVAFKANNYALDFVYYSKLGEEDNTLHSMIDVSDDNDVIFIQFELTKQFIIDYLDPGHSSSDDYEEFEIEIYAELPIDVEKSDEYSDGVLRLWNNDFGLLDDDVQFSFYLPYINDTLSPVINGQTNYITNVDNPINEATIKSGLSAVDNVDGNIPSSAFVLVSDGYTENKNTIGEYDIVYKVSDSSGNEATVTVHVHVVDITKPTISGTNAYTVVYNQTLNLDGVKNGLIVNDNYDTGLIPTLVSDGYTSNKTVKGVYEVKYKATDTSNNVSDVFVVEVTVIDNIKPVISGNNTYTTPYNVQLTIDALKSVLSATDGYDGNITSQIALKTDNYTANKNVKGSYQVIFTVADSSNNSIDYTINITVVDNIKPTISGTNAYTTGSTVKLLEANIRAALTAVDDYDGTLTIQLISDNYSSNYKNVGDHTIKYRATDSSNNSMDYTVTVTVTDDVPPVIYTTDVFINIDGALNYTLEQIIEHLINIGQLEAGINLENYIIAENNYDPDTPGEYEVVLTRQEYASSALPETLSINITVLEPETVEEPSENPTDDDPISDITPEPNYLDEIKDFFIKNFGTIVIGIVLLAIGLLVIKFVNPSNRRRR